MQTFKHAWTQTLILNEDRTTCTLFKPDPAEYSTLFKLDPA